MTFHDHNHTPLRCRLSRFWFSVAGSSRGPAARHIEHCDACQAFFAAADGLEQQLRRGAARHAQQAPADLERRINLAVADSGVVAARKGAVAGHRSFPFAARWIIGSVAGAAAALAVALVLMQSQADGPGKGIQPSEQELVQSTVKKLNQLPGLLRETLPAQNTTISPPNPLREIDAVYADTQAALRFLAINFLPAVPVTLTPSAARRDASS
jgi:hypothetical protein